MTFILLSYANFFASDKSFTSKQSIVIYSVFLHLFSSYKNGVITLSKSFLLTSPIQTVETGILLSFKNFNKASNEPNVDAATPTPSFFNLTFFLTFLISSINDYS